MGLKIELHTRARADLQQIKDYLTDQADADTADRVRAHIRQRILRLSDRPLLGIATTHPEIRILSPTRFPYRIYYSIQANSIVILYIRLRRGKSRSSTI